MIRVEMVKLQNASRHISKICFVAEFIRFSLFLSSVGRIEALPCVLDRRSGERVRPYSTKNYLNGT